SYHTPQEGDDFVERMDGAIESLVKGGIVDEKRIGMVGFSHAGFDTFYALTHSKHTRLAAAEIADAVTYSYPQHLFDAATGGGISPPPRMNGGEFWSNKASWLEKELLFNVDRLQAPTLFVGIGESGQLTRE